MTVTKYDIRILQVKREVITGLWIVHLQSLDRPLHQNSIIHQVNDKENEIMFLLKSAFSRAQDTWARSIDRGCFYIWHALTAKDINIMPKSEAKIKYHLTYIIKNIQSTTNNRNSGDKHTITNPS